jgi:hypothetical protein
MQPRSSHLFPNRAEIESQTFRHVSDAIRNVLF